MNGILTGGTDDRLNYFFTSGYYCTCGAWVASGTLHTCAGLQPFVPYTAPLSFEHRHIWLAPEIIEIEGARLLVQRCSSPLCNKIDVLKDLPSRARRIPKPKHDTSEKRQ